MDYESCGLFDEYLTSDEKILWCERTIQRPTLKEMGDRGVFWIVCFALIGLVTLCLLLCLHQTGLLWAVIIWLFCAAPMLLIMYAMGQFKREYYCITDQRLLIHNGKRLTASHQLGLLRDLRYTESPRGVGSIHFTTLEHRHSRKGGFITGIVTAVESVSEGYQLMLDGGSTEKELSR